MFTWICVTFIFTRKNILPHNKNYQIKKCINFSIFYIFLKELIVYQMLLTNQTVSKSFLQHHFIIILPHNIYKINVQYFLHLFYRKRTRRLCFFVMKRYFLSEKFYEEFGTVINVILILV